MFKRYENVKLKDGRTGHIVGFESDGSFKVQLDGQPGDRPVVRVQASEIVR